MNTVVKLGVVKKPTVSEEIRAEIIEKLESALVEARAGQVEEILIIMLHPGEEYSQKSTSTQSLIKWVGYLTKTASDWMDESRRYRRGEE